MEAVKQRPARKDDRIIIHFVSQPFKFSTHPHHIQDYDCFYASVLEVENPSLRSKPLAVQQKQIVVTCNYVARSRGLRKLELISDAKKKCPDLVIILGEDLTKFRDASKANFLFLKNYSWSNKLERLGFDEVFMDVTDMIDYNEALLNPNHLESSFFHLSRTDPTVGFTFDGTRIAGHAHPEEPLGSSAPQLSVEESRLLTRLRLGSHLANYLRTELDQRSGFTSAVGISTNKALSKLVGNVHKPNAQTTLLPPYSHDVRTDERSNVLQFMDSHDVGRVPGIGFKMAQRIREFVLSRAADFDSGFIYGATKEDVSVRAVRLHPTMNPLQLEQTLGAGFERDVGTKVWGLLHGVDDAPVKDFQRFPSQISIEDSYLDLDSLAKVQKEMKILATSLVKRMRADLLETVPGHAAKEQEWIAQPRVLRLSTRPRPPAHVEWSRSRSWNRISKSATVPTFVFDLSKDVDEIVDRLVQERLAPMFRRLHPEQRGWSLSLINICVANMVERAGEGSLGRDRDIGRMMRGQQDHLKPWQVEDRDIPPDEDGGERQADRAHDDDGQATSYGPGAIEQPDTLSNDSSSFWLREEDYGESRESFAGGMACSTCGSLLPLFAMAAHQRFHELGDA